MRLDDLYDIVAHYARDTEDREIKNDMLQTLIDNRVEWGVQNDTKELTERFEKIVHELSQHYTKSDVEHNMQELVDMCDMTIEDPDDESKHSFDPLATASDNGSTRTEYVVRVSHDPLVLRLLVINLACTFAGLILLVTK